MAVHKVTFMPAERHRRGRRRGLSVRPTTGSPGSLLDIALAKASAWSTTAAATAPARPATSSCGEGEDNLSPMEPDEEDRLDTAEGLTLHSRLGCQAIVQGDVVVEIVE